MVAPNLESTNEQQTLYVNRFPDYITLGLILVNTDENNNIWDNGRIIGRLEMTREELREIVIQMWEEQREAAE
jgi:hypothetical protein